MLPEQRPLTIAVIGLGYVGLPLAAALAKHHRVLGFDIDAVRIASLQAGTDQSGELTVQELADAPILFTASSDDLVAAQVYIIAVPTPVDADKLPDLRPLLGATRTVARYLKPQDVVIYESTVYPGATEEHCVPELEQHSGLRFNHDFFVGYSPERINPGDRQRRLPDIVKVTSGSTPECADFVDALYRRIVPAGTHRAPSIRVAEAAKAVENTQRDINIAFANELAKMFSKMGIDTEAVLAAAASKWNFMPVKPGLVGGHCIGVDPYYLIHKAEAVGAEARLIRAAREINESMSAFVCERLRQSFAKRGQTVSGKRVLILGITFKENCADIRNTRVVEVVTMLREAGAIVTVHDPVADPDDVRAHYGIELCAAPDHAAYDAIIIAVAHRTFALGGRALLANWLRTEGLILDVKAVLPDASDDERL